MEIKHDRSYIYEQSKMLIEHGYGREDLHSLRFYFEYTETEQKANEAAFANARSREEWNALCVEAAKAKSAEMQPVMEAIAKEFVCYQYEDDCGAPFGSDRWDLYFWCNSLSLTTQTTIDGRDFSYFTLTFNSKMTAEQRSAVCDRALEFLLRNFSHMVHLKVAVQYCAALDEKKIERDAKTISPKLVGDGTYIGMEGKFVQTGSGLGFKKKSERNLFCILTATDILATAFERGLSVCNRYYKMSDGFFSYYVNTDTGEKKFELEEGDVCVESTLDDLHRKSAVGGSEYGT